MKKIILCLMVAALSFTLVPLQASPDTKPISASLVDPKPVESKESVETKELLLRLDEIKNMDKSSLSPKEKKELRKEVKLTKNRLSEVSGGVYLSAAALILIVILLIVLL
jgi:hypothetical protein